MKRTTILSFSLTILLLSILSVSTAFSQGKTTEDVPKEMATKKNIEKIVGTWQLGQITGSAKAKGGENSDSQANAYQSLEFSPEGRYTARTGKQSTDVGSYRMNENHSILYLESDSDDITPTEWSVSFQNNTMTLKGREGNDATKRAKYTYNKTKEGLSTNQQQ